MESNQACPAPGIRCFDILLSVPVEKCLCCDCSDELRSLSWSGISHQCRPEAWRLLSVCKYLQLIKFLTIFV